MLKNIQAKVPDKPKAAQEAAQDLKITVQSVVDAILKLGHEEKDGNGGGTICSAAKIKAFFIAGNHSKADTIIIEQLKEILQLGVEEGAFHQPRKAKGRRGGIDLRQSFVVPQNNNNLVNDMEPAAIMIPTKEKPSITCTNGNKTQQEPTSNGNKLQNNSIPQTCDDEIVQSQSSSVEQKGATTDAERFVRAAYKGDLLTLQSLHAKSNEMVNCFYNKMTALQEACRFGRKEVVEWLLDVAKAAIDIPDESTEGFRAIHWAVQANRDDIIRLLLEKGAELDGRCRLGRTALYIAIEINSFKCFHTLIQSDCDVNKESLAGWTPFHLSIHSENDRFVAGLISSNRLLIDWKKRCNGFGWSLLHHAVEKDKIRAVQWILKNGVTNNDLSMEISKRTRSTVLHMACDKQNFQMAKIILDHQRALATPSGLTLLLEAKNTKDMTALMMSLIHLDYPTIELLVESGADVKATALEDLDVPYSLLHASNEIQTLSGSSQSSQSSPEIFKMVENYPTCPLLAYLISRGFCWERKDDEGRSAADILLQKGCPKEVVDKLNKLYMRSSGKTTECMGEKDCDLPATHQLSCSIHNSEAETAYKACSECFVPFLKEARCAGCPKVKLVCIGKDSSSF